MSAGLDILLSRSTGLRVVIDEGIAARTGTAAAARLASPAKKAATSATGAACRISPKTPRRRGREAELVKLRPAVVYAPVWPELVSSTPYDHPSRGAALERGLVHVSDVAADRPDRGRYPAVPARAAISGRDVPLSPGSSSSMGRRDELLGVPRELHPGDVAATPTHERHRTVGHHEVGPRQVVAAAGACL